MTALALKTCEPPGPDAAVEEPTELLLEKGGDADGIGAGGGREERLQVLAHDLVEDGACRIAGRVPRGRDGRMAVVAGGGLASHETGA